MKWFQVVGIFLCKSSSCTWQIRAPSAAAIPSNTARCQCSTSGFSGLCGPKREKKLGGMINMIARCILQVFFYYYWCYYCCLIDKLKSCYDFNHLWTDLREQVAVFQKCLPHVPTWWNGTVLFTMLQLSSLIREGTNVGWWKTAWQTILCVWVFYSPKKALCESFLCDFQMEPELLSSLTWWSITGQQMSCDGPSGPFFLSPNCFTTPLFTPLCPPKSTVCCIVLALTWQQHSLGWLRKRLTIILLWFSKPVHPSSISSCSPPETCTSDWSKNHKVNTL